MKSFAILAFSGLLAVAAAAPFTDEQLQKGQEHVQTCIAKTNIDPAVVQKLKAGDFSVSDEKAQCFTYCFFKEADFVDENGNQKDDVILKKLSTHSNEAQIKQFIAKCKDNNGTTPCEKAFLTYKCYHGLVKN